jgi:hypothetical protein
VAPSQKVRDEVAADEAATSGDDNFPLRYHCSSCPQFGRARDRNFISTLSALADDSLDEEVDGHGRFVASQKQRKEMSSLP